MRIRPYIKKSDMMGYDMRSKPVLSPNATKFEKQERINQIRAMKKAYRNELKKELDEMIDEYLNNKNKK